MRKLLIIWGLLFGGMESIMGQRLENMISIPATPQTTALFKAVAAPVSYYTGQPDISIPIYTISQDGVEIPISISFSTSGIFVTEEATSIGLGIRLNWGGSIIRSANGRPDERGLFYEAYKIGNLKQGLPKDYSNTSTASFFPYNGFPASFDTAIERESEYTAINTYNDPYAQGSNGVSTDLRPDDFHYNVLGKSGLFKFNQADRKFVTFPLDDIQIDKTLANGEIQNFEITKSDGVKIILGDGAIESSTKYNTSVHTNYNLFVPQTWFIKKITTLKNSIIDFSYIDNKYDHTTETRTMTFIPEKPYATYEEHYIQGDDYSATEKLIKTIYFKDGKLDFVYVSDRTDFPLSHITTGVTQQAPRLSQIILFDITNKKIKTFQFYQSYFSVSLTPSVADRLRLDSLTIQDSTSLVNEKYQFEYNTSDIIPSKQSLNKDRWGYYNGINNERYISSPDNKMFTIKKITFPTGGERTYDFEENQVPWDNQYMAKLREISNDWFDPYSSNHLIINGSTLYNPYGSSNQTTSPDFILSGSAPYDNVRTIYGDEFTIQGDTNVNAENIILSGNTTFIHPEITLSQLNLWAYNIEIGIQEKVGSTFSDIYYTIIDRYRTSPPILSTNNFKLTIPSIANGTYRIFVRMTSPPSYVITTTYPQYTNAVLTYQKTNFHNIRVGGLRVKEIIDRESTNDYKTTYEYVGLDNYGSGKLVSAPEYKEFISQRIITPTGGEVSYNGYRVSSEPVFPLLQTQGGNVGYTSVIKKQIGGTEEIKEEFVYNFIPSLRSGYLKEYFQEAEPKLWQSGKLLSSKKYKNNSVISEDIFYYGLSNETDKGFTEEITTNLTSAGLSVYDLQIDRRFDNHVMIGYPPTPIFTVLYAVDSTTTYYDGTFTRSFSPAVKIPYFKTYSGFDKPKSKTTNDYSDTNVITQTENYYYDGLPGSLALSRVETVNSKNEIISSRFYYPQDLTTEPFMTQMVNAYRIGTPVKTQKFKNGIKLFEEKFIYSQDTSTGDLLLPKFVYSATFPNANSNIVSPPVGQLEKKITYDQYDMQGNLLQYHEEYGLNTAIIWGYNKQYPIAECRNSVISSVAYTSFESADKGNWTFSDSMITHPSAPTGSKGYSLGAGDITKSGLNSGTTYLVSYWKRDSVGTVTVNSTSGTSLTSRNGWILYRHKITGTTSITVSGTAFVDELRLYPEGAQMKTYTYQPLVGLTSQCDINNKIAYYEYDSFNRLKLIRDQDKNIIKTFDYKYKEQQ